MAENQRAEDYRRKAEAAERRAQERIDHETRERYMKIARKWREMAANAEELDRLALSQGGPSECHQS